MVTSFLAVIAIVVTDAENAITTTTQRETMTEVTDDRQEGMTTLGAVEVAIVATTNLSVCLVNFVAH